MALRGVEIALAAGAMVCCFMWLYILSNSTADSNSNTLAEMECDLYQPPSQEHRSQVGCETESVSLDHECQSFSCIDSSTTMVQPEPTLAQSHKKLAFNDENDGAAPESEVSTDTIEEMFKRSVGNIFISELKDLNTKLSGLGKDQTFTSDDPKMAFEIENLKHACREMVIFNHRFIRISTSLAKYASNEEYIYQLEEDLLAGKYQRLKPFIDGIIHYISQCKSCLDQHQHEYEKVKKLVREFLPCSEAIIIYENVDGYVVINPESTSDKFVTEECSEYSPHQSLKGLKGPVGGLISSFTSSIQNILSSHSRNPSDATCTDHSKLNSTCKLISQFQKNVAGLCESLTELEDYLRSLDETTVTCEQIHYIQSTMKDVLKATKEAID